MSYMLEWEKKRIANLRRIFTKIKSLLMDRMKENEVLLLLAKNCTSAGFSDLILLQDKRKRNLLHYAMLYNQEKAAIEMVRLNPLIASESRYDEKDDYNLSSFLIWAIAEGFHELAKNMVWWNIDSLFKKNTCGENALDFCLSIKTEDKRALSVYFLETLLQKINPPSPGSPNPGDRVAHL